MLKEFRVRNFMNFRDELVFSLASEKNYEFNNYVISNGVIKTATVIGYNASGKSNLGNAILDITNHITDNGKTNISKGLYTNLNSEDKEAHFLYVFQFGEHQVRYQYDKLDTVTVTRERVWIDSKEVLRKDSDSLLIDLAGAEHLNANNINMSLSIVKSVYGNSHLDITDTYSKVFVEFVKFVNGMLVAMATDIRRYAGFTTTVGNMFSLICELDNGVEELELFLRHLGLEYNLVEQEDEDGKNIYCKYGSKTVKFSALCSSGTRSLIFFFYWYKQRKNIKFMYLDEFDAFYHTELAKQIMTILTEMEEMQIVVSTHNTDVISNEFLRPDCYFVLEDNEMKPLYKRTRKALREAHNLQKMYKAGAFNETL